MSKQNTLSVSSAKNLATYVASLEAQSQKTIEVALEALAVELEVNQKNIRDALLMYRDSLQSPSTEDFYDLIEFIGRLTANFCENRININMVSEKSLSSWCNRHDAPDESVRRHIMCLFIDAAITSGLLSGVGKVKDFLSLSSDDAIEGEWLLRKSCSEMNKITGVSAELLQTQLSSFSWYTELPSRIQNRMKDDNIDTLGDLLRQNESELRHVPGFGRVSLNKLKDVLASQGYTLGSVS